MAKHQISLCQIETSTQINILVDCLIALQEIIKSFLFNGVDELGSKAFTDYFPDYKCDDGTINKKRSMIGKSFEIRPWDTQGEFIGNSLIQNVHSGIAFRNYQQFEPFFSLRSLCTYIYIYISPRLLPLVHYEGSCNLSLVNYSY